MSKIQKGSNNDWTVIANGATEASARFAMVRNDVGDLIRAKASQLAEEIVRELVYKHGLIPLEMAESMAADARIRGLSEGQRMAAAAEALLVEGRKILGVNDFEYDMEETSPGHFEFDDSDPEDDDFEWDDTGYDDLDDDEDWWDDDELDDEIDQPEDGQDGCGSCAVNCGACPSKKENQYMSKEEYDVLFGNKKDDKAELREQVEKLTKALSELAKAVAK